MVCGSTEQYCERAGGLAPLLGVPLRSQPLTLERHNRVPGFSRALFGGLRRGCATNDSPKFFVCNLALHLKTGLGSSIGPVMAHELEVRINHRAGEILRHKVCRIVGS